MWDKLGVHMYKSYEEVIYVSTSTTLVRSTRSMNAWISPCRRGIFSRGGLQLGIATETDFFGPDRESNLFEQFGRTLFAGPMFSVLRTWIFQYCRDRPTERVVGSVPVIIFLCFTSSLKFPIRIDVRSA